MQTHGLCDIFGCNDFWGICVEQHESCCNAVQTQVAPICDSFSCLDCRGWGGYVCWQHGSVWTIHKINY